MHPEVAEATGFAIFILGADGLGIVLDDFQIVALRNGVYRVHVRGMTVEMDGQDGACAWSNFCFQLSWIDGEGRRIDIDKNWNGAEERDGVGGGDKTEGRQQNFIARAHASGVKSEQ